MTTLIQKKVYNNYLKLGVLAPEQPKNELALIQVINFSKHQKIDKANEKESDLSAPIHVADNKNTTSLSIDEERNGKKLNGKEERLFFLQILFQIIFKRLGIVEKI